MRISFSQRRSSDADRRDRETLDRPRSRHQSMGCKGWSQWTAQRSREGSHDWAHRGMLTGAIMNATRHDSVGLCWNSNPTDLVHGSVKPSFDLLRPWIKNVHINELADDRYPWRELFALLQRSKYERYTLCEVGESKDPEQFLRWYRAPWQELSRA